MPLHGFLPLHPSQQSRQGQRSPFSPSISVPSTGSSLMPQKKNPDSLELIRSKAGRVFGRVRRAGSRARPLADPEGPGKLPGWAPTSSLLTLTLPSVCWAPDDPQGTSEHLQQGLTGVRLWRRDLSAHTPPTSTSRQGPHRVATDPDHPESSLLSLGVGVGCRGCRVPPVESSGNTSVREEAAETSPSATCLPLRRTRKPCLKCQIPWVPSSRWPLASSPRCR